MLSQKERKKGVGLSWKKSGAKSTEGKPGGYSSIISASGPTQNENARHDRVARKRGTDTKDEKGTTKGQPEQENGSWICFQREHRSCSGCDSGMSLIKEKGIFGL